MELKWMVIYNTTICDNFVMDNDSFHMIYIMPQADRMNHIEIFRRFSRAIVREENNCHCERISWSDHKRIYCIHCLSAIKPHILKNSSRSVGEFLPQIQNQMQCCVTVYIESDAIDRVRCGFKQAIWYDKLWISYLHWKIWSIKSLYI